MCDRCDKEVIDMGILESDIPNLPYKPMHRFCIVDGCKGKTTIRDYGIAPLYFWPVKITRTKTKWRGGWVSSLHGYICSKHFKEYNAGHVAFMRKHITNDKTMMDKVKKVK